MRRSQRRCATRYRCALSACFFFAVATPDAGATTITDAQQLIQLSVWPTVSTAANHVAWQFDLAVLNGEQEVSSIDAGSGQFGFFGEAFRQVNPFGLQTIFTDNNGLFDVGEDETTDSQFAFHSASLLQAPGTASEGADRLTAAFTGFTPIRAESGAVTFAQIVLPFSEFGQFRGGFVVRPKGELQGTLIGFDQIDFGGLPGDFDDDQDVDGSDLLRWQRGDSNDPLSAMDLGSWQSFYGQSALPPSMALAVPEPRTLAFVLTAFSLTMVRRATA